MVPDVLKKRKLLPFSGKVLLFIILSLGVLIMVTPFVWMLSTSFGTVETAFSLPPRWLPDLSNLNAYKQLLKSIPFLRYMWNSFKIASIITLGQLFTCSTAAYAFARIRFKGSNVLFLLLLSSMMIPLQVTIVPLFILMRRLKLYDTHASLILPVLISAFGVFLLRQFFLTIPKELEDAARIDGAGHLTIYSRIILPLSGPALSALAILAFLYFWNELFRPLIFLSSLENFTIPVGLVMLRGQYDIGSPTRLMAAVTIAVIPVLIVFLFAQRYIIEGITLTGIK